MGFHLNSLCILGWPRLLHLSTQVVVYQQIHGGTVLFEQRKLTWKIFVVAVCLLFAGGVCLLVSVGGGGGDFVVPLKFDGGPRTR